MTQQKAVVVLGVFANPIRVYYQVGQKFEVDRSFTSLPTKAEALKVISDRLNKPAVAQKVSEPAPEADGKAAEKTKPTETKSPKGSA